MGIYFLNMSMDEYIITHLMTILGIDCLLWTVRMRSPRLPNCRLDMETDPRSPYRNGLGFFKQSKFICALRFVSSTMNTSLGSYILDSTSQFLYEFVKPPPRIYSPRTPLACPAWETAKYPRRLRIHPARSSTSSFNASRVACRSSHSVSTHTAANLVDLIYMTLGS